MEFFTSFLHTYSLNPIAHIIRIKYHVFACISCHAFQTQFEKFPKPKADPWLNLKNLSGGLNLSRGLNMVGST